MPVMGLLCPGTIVVAVMPGAFAPAAPPTGEVVVCAGGAPVPFMAAGAGWLQPNAPTRSTACEMANPVALFTFNLPLVIETRLPGSRDLPSVHQHAQRVFLSN